MCVRAWVWGESAKLADFLKSAVDCGFAHEKSAISADLKSVNGDEFA